MICELNCAQISKDDLLLNFCFKAKKSSLKLKSFKFTASEHKKGQRGIFGPTLWKMLPDVFQKKSFIPFSVNRDQLISQSERVISWNDLLNAQNRSPLKPGEKKKKGGIEISDWKLACIKLYRPQWQNIHKVPLLQLLITSKLFSLFTVIQAMKIDGRGKSNRGRWGFKGNMNNSSLPRHLVGMHKFNENSIFLIRNEKSNKFNLLLKTEGEP